MGSLIAGAATSACTMICCGACNKCGEAKTGAISRLPYIFLFFVSSIFALVMSLYGEEEIGFKFYHTHVCQTDQCQGNGSVFRVSLCLFIFEAFHVMIVYKAPSFHHLFFAFKFMAFVAVLVCAFVIDGLNPIFDHWAEAARYFSGMYLLIQILIFLSWSYDLNEYLRIRGDQLSEYEEENGYSHKCCCECIPGNAYHWALGILSVGCALATFVCLALFYPLYDQNNDNPHCAIHESVTSITIILAGLTLAFSVIRGDGSFAVAAMICFYSTFLLFESMQSDPDNAEGHESCNLFHRARNGLSLWIGFFITFASLFYAAFRSDTMAILGKDPKFVMNGGINDVEMDETLLTAKDKKEAADNDNNDDIVDVNESNYDDVDEQNNESDVDEEDDGDLEDAKANLYFHIVMMLAAAYMSMLFTNWGTNTQSIDTTGTISFIVGVCSSWTAFLLFWWTLCAPAICPNRFPGNVEED